jgi:hypothetical protein
MAEEGCAWEEFGGNVAVSSPVSTQDLKRTRSFLFGSI